MAFSNSRGMIYQYICPPLQRINDEYYTTIFKQLLVRICRQCLTLVNSWILLQDNLPPHKARNRLALRKCGHACKSHNVTFCLYTVRDPIHRLLVQQSEADHACGSVCSLSQCTEKQIHAVNLHRTLSHCSLGTP